MPLPNGINSESLRKLLHEPDIKTYLNEDPTSRVDPVASKAETPIMSEIDRLSRLEGSYDALKVVRPMLITVVSVVLAALVFVLGYMSLQIQATNAKIDAIPQRLSEEFRAMRAETAAQTSAIAASITAARQVQPQIVVMPVPSPSAPPARP